jgi:hypothetical protein
MDVMILIILDIHVFFGRPVAGVCAEGRSGTFRELCINRTAAPLTLAMKAI